MLGQTRSLILGGVRRAVEHMLLTYICMYIYIYIYICIHNVYACVYIYIYIYIYIHIGYDRVLIPVAPFGTCLAPVFYRALTCLTLLVLLWHYDGEFT